MPDLPDPVTTASSLSEFAKWLPQVAALVEAQRSQIDELTARLVTVETDSRAAVLAAELSAAGKANEYKELRDMYTAQSARVGEIVERNRKLAGRIDELEAKLLEYPNHPEVKAARRAALQKKQQEIADELKTISGD